MPYFVRGPRWCLIVFIVLFTFSSQSQLSFSFENVTAFPNSNQPNTFNGDIRMCNNSDQTFPGNSWINIDMIWPSLVPVDLAYNIKVVSNGSASCDSKTISFQTDWDGLAPGECIESKGVSGEYEGAFVLPPYGITSEGDTVWQEFTATSYYPTANNARNWEFSFDAECLIPSPGYICLNEAQLSEWSGGSNLDLADVRVPENRKNWAIAAAHSQSMFTNMIGAEITSIDYFFAQAIIEGRMGCDAGIITDPLDDNPINYRSISSAAGCFQILPDGMNQLKQFYPNLYGSLSSPILDYNEIIAGDNFVTAALSKSLYDATSFTIWEKMKCWNPIDFFDNANDPYAAEELLAFAYHDGPFGSESILENIFDNNRTTFLTNTNLATHLANSSSSVGVAYAERMRNNLMQLQDNFAIDPSLVSHDAQVNWGGLNTGKPDHHEYHGCYDEPISWSDFEAYIEEAGKLFWTADLQEVKSKTKIAFDAINGGGDVNFTALGAVIDAMTLAFPAYSPDKGLGETYNASLCGAPSISLHSCDQICPGEEAEIWVNFMGQPNFSAVIQYEDGTLFNVGPTIQSPYILSVNQPGQYKVISFTDATGTVFLNCHNSSVVIEHAGDAFVEWNDENTGSDGCSTGDLKLNLTGTGPWEVFFTKNGGSAQVISIPDNTPSPYTVDSEIPVDGDQYILTRLVAGGCDVELNDTILFCTDCVQPQMEILTQDTTICSGDTAFLKIQFSGLSNYDLYYRINDISFSSTDISKDYIELPIWVEGSVVIDSLRDDACLNDTLTQSRSITINPIPTVDLGSDTTICSGAIDFDAGNSGADYLWSTGETTQTIQKGSSDPGHYWVAVTKNGCSDTDSVRLDISSELIVDLGEDFEICTGTTTELDAGFGFGYTYVWNGLVNQSESTYLTGEGEVRLEVFDDEGCSGKDTIVITEVNPLVIDLGNDTSICLGDQALTFGMKSGRTDISVVSWQDGSTKDYSYASNQAGWYWLEVDSAGCSYRDSLFLVVNDLPTMSLGPDTFLCEGASSMMRLSGGTFSTYQWFDVTNTTTEKLTEDEFLDLSKAGKYALVVSDTNSCLNSDTIQIIEKRASVIGLNSDTTICLGGSAIVSVPESIAQTPGATWIWLNDSSSNSSITISNQTESASIAVILNYTNSFGCISKDTTLVQVRNDLPIQLKDTAICEGENIIFNSGYPTSGFTFNWQNNSTNNSFEIEHVLESDEGQISISIISDEGCTGDTSIELTVNRKPNPILSTNSICSGENRILDHGLEDVESIWDHGEINNPITVSTGGVYRVRVVDENNCEDTASVSITEFSLPPLNLPADQLLCIGDLYRLGTGLNEETYSHQWFGLISDTTSEVLVSESGEYIVEVMNLSTSCTDYDTVVFTFLDVPNVDLGPDLSVCAGESIELRSINSDVKNNFNWNTGGSSAAINVEEGGLYWLEVSNSQCSDTDSLMVFIENFPMSWLQNDTIICFDDFENGFTLDAGRTVGEIEWSTGEMGNEIQIFEPGIFTVEISNDAGCKTEDKVVIKNECPARIWLANSFTVDGNGLNDQWEIKGTGIEEVSLLLFNRWGEQIWEGNALGDFWDGTYQGNFAQQDVYVYKLTYSYFNLNALLQTKMRIGYVSLLR